MAIQPGETVADIGTGTGLFVEPFAAAVGADLSDGGEITICHEPLLNQIEVAIRAYDPCLSCATHAMGKMPLEVVLVNEQNEVVDRLEKRINGDIQRTYP